MKRKPRPWVTILAITLYVALQVALLAGLIIGIIIVGRVS